MFVHVLADRWASLLLHFSLQDGLISALAGALFQRMTAAVDTLCVARASAPAARPLCCPPHDFAAVPGQNAVFCKFCAYVQQLGATGEPP